MNFFLLALTTLITLAPGRADRAPESAPSNFSGNKEWGEVQSLFNFTDVQIAALPSKPATDAVWENAKCKGELFTHASKLDADKAVGSFPYITSPWDGDLTDELKIWGYSDVSEPSSAWGMCSFDFPWDIKSAFVALGINHKSSKMKGPNKCFDVTHRDGPAIERPPNGKLPEVEDQYYTVNNKRYRATGAKFLIGVNPTDGCVYFMNRKSPESAAKETWWDMNPAKDDLPALRASSDIAWGLWNRMSCGSNINKFFSMHIVNEETMSLIRRALNAKDVEQATRWPGTTFEAGSDAFSALLGSPNAVAASFFLIQHKAQLGGNKIIVKITVFKSDSFDNVHMLFWVEDAPPAEQAGSAMASVSESSVVEWNRDGKNLVRKHMLRAKVKL